MGSSADGVLQSADGVFLVADGILVLGRLEIVDRADWSGFLAGGLGSVERGVGWEELCLEVGGLWAYGCCGVGVF